MIAVLFIPWIVFIIVQKNKTLWDFLCFKSNEASVETRYPIAILNSMQEVPNPGMLKIFSVDNKIWKAIDSTSQIIALSSLKKEVEEQMLNKCRDAEYNIGTFRRDIFDWKNFTRPRLKVSFFKDRRRAASNYGELFSYLCSEVLDRYKVKTSSYEIGSKIFFSKYLKILDQIFRSIQLKYVDEICLAHCRVYPVPSRAIIERIDNQIESDGLTFDDVNFDYFWRSRDNFKRLFYISDNNEFK